MRWLLLVPFVIAFVWVCRHAGLTERADYTHTAPDNVVSFGCVYDWDGE